MSPQAASVALPRRGTGAGTRRLWLFLGPAMLVSVGYMDPGNWATDLEGGARFGYQLLWVLVLSNLIAQLLQNLCARLGIVSGMDLAQACRAMYPRPAVWLLWVLCEVAIITCDLAEVVGSAVALNLLFGIPLVWGAVITAFDVFLILLLQHYGIRRLEAIITACVLTVAGCFAVELYFVRPSWTEAAAAFGAQLNGASLYVAVGILGATVMPHNLYLHSALVKTRGVAANHAARRQAIRYNFIDTLIALNFAFLINAAILILAAALFFRQGIPITDLRDAHRLLTPLLGVSIASTLFAIALLCAGQSATITGTMAGQIVMEGFLRLRTSAWLRSLITRGIAVLPAIAIIAWAGEERTLAVLVSTQVVLSLQLPFAIVPLLRFTSHKALMGQYANGLALKCAGWMSAAFVITANMWLVARELTALGNAYLAAALGTVYVALLAYTMFVPLARPRDDAITSDLLLRSGESPA